MESGIRMMPTPAFTGRMQADMCVNPNGYGPIVHPWLGRRTNLHEAFFLGRQWGDLRYLLNKLMFR
jgi:hypothetical protein